MNLFRKITLCVLLAICMMWGTWESVYAASEDASRPNVVLFYIDDLGYSDLSSYGSEYFESPNIDKLLESGLKFTDAYSNAPLCAPSRIGMLSGRHSARVGCYEVAPGIWNEVDWYLRHGWTSEQINVNWKEEVDFNAPPNKLDLPQDRKIMSEYFQDLGYFTGFFGKWHVGTDTPSSRGFDDYYMIEGRNLELEKSRIGPVSEGYPKAEGASGKFMTECAKEFLDRVDGRPFFLYLPYYLMHDPLEAEVELVEKYKRKKPSIIHKNPTYAAMMEMLDESVGEVLDELERLGLRDNTLIIFTSDNGGLLGQIKPEPALYGYEVGDVTSNYPLRLGKTQLFEGGIRVPMGISYGDRVAKGTYEGPVSQLDLLPTVLELIGHPDYELISESLDGRSLTDIMKDPSAVVPERAFFWHYPSYRGLTTLPQEGVDMRSYHIRPTTAMRRGDWKLFESLETGEVKLYNLRNDIGERNDLSKEHPELVAQMLKEMKQWRKETNAPMPTRK